jgi:hypothetical protein
MNEDQWRSSEFIVIMNETSELHPDFVVVL